jgi:hypothetical protein
MAHVCTGAPNPRGMLTTPEAHGQADRLRNQFEAGASVTASGDGLSFTAFGTRPPAADAGPDEDG